jgi:alkanesulfonate monooxygenase SsuD/methylene tetrahydromethanopterin reductase-like flavin-dependent oxidoreductase (luciferase family)
MAELGIMIEAQDGSNWDRWDKLIDACHNGGLNGLWRSDHLFSLMGDTTRDALALVPALTAVALKSDRLEFGAVVCPMTFRHPVMLAREAVALDTLSNGRYTLGIGAGWNVREHEAFGFDLLPLKTRMDRMEESLEVITRLHTGEVVSYQGEQFQLDNAQMRHKPTRGDRVPIMIGGSGRQRTLNMVARFADEWNCVNGDLASYDELKSVLEGHCAAVGRDPSTIKRSIMGGFIIGRNENEMLDRAKKLKEISPGNADLEPHEIIERARNRWGFAGTPEEVAESIKKLEGKGVSRFMLQMLDQDDLDAVELIAKEVNPRVQ